MSDFKIKVDLELSDDLKDKIDKYVKESVLRVVKNIDELQCEVDELISDVTYLKGEK